MCSGGSSLLRRLYVVGLFSDIQGTVMLAGFLIALLTKAYAFVTSLTFPAEAYEAAGKLTKNTWALILGIGLALQLVFQAPLGLFNIAFLIAAFVYLADVRPALLAVTRR